MCPSLHVLLVDDDELAILNTRRALRRGVAVGKVTIAVDGRDALERLLGGRLELEHLVVITDLDMPRMSGLELLASIRGERTLRDLPVMVLTASTEEADRQAAFSLGVDGYFSKASEKSPFEELLACLREHLDSDPGATHEA